MKYTRFLSISKFYQNSITLKFASKTQFTERHNVENQMSNEKHPKHVWAQKEQLKSNVRFCMCRDIRAQY